MFLEEGFRIFDDLSPVEGVFTHLAPSLTRKEVILDIHVLKLGVLTWQVRILCTDFVMETWNLFSYGIIEHGMFPWAPSTNMAINTSVAINPFSLNLGNKSFLYLLGA